MSVRLVGEFDISAAPVLREALLRASSRRADVLVDLAGVTFMDAASFGLIHQARRRVEADGHTLRLIGAIPTVARIAGILDIEF